MLANEGPLDMHERFGFEQFHMGRGVRLTQVTPANTRPNPRTLKMMARELLYSAMVRVERITSQMLKDLRREGET